MGEDKSTVSRTQSAYANWIMSRKDTSNKRYLEVGPDIGLVANQIVKISKPEFVSFLEPNRSVRAELLESVAGVESKEVVDFIDELVTKDFSLIVGVHVYDHLLHLSKIFWWFKRISKIPVTKILGHRYRTLN